jgi:DNA (cytosine-5)-methyltransferase 1
MFRVIKEARPKFVLAENVPGIIPMELDNVLSDLEGIGYATRSFVIPACAVDARHRRDRLWIVARRIVVDGEQQGLEGHAGNGNGRDQPGRQQARENGSTSEAGLRRAMADTDRAGLQEREGQCGATIQRTDTVDRESGTIRQSQSSVCGMAVRLPEGLHGYWQYPDEWEGVPRVSKGVKDRVSRLKALGNSIQSQVAYELLREIRKLL